MAETSAVRADAWTIAALAGVLATLVAAQSVGPSATLSSPVEAAQVVDRTHKSDRLDTALDAHASGRTALRHLLQRARSELREACEPPASPIVDPLLAKLPGRCLT